MIATQSISSTENKSRKLQNDLLTSVFTRLAARLRTTAFRVVENEETVDDVLQESFVKLWNKRGQLTDERKIEGTAVVTVRNASLDALRRSEVRRHDNIDDNPAVAATTTDDPSADLAETYAEVTALIDERLSERDRRILYLRDRDGWEYEDIAENFNLPLTSVRVIVSRSRKIIRELYRTRHK